MGISLYDLILIAIFAFVIWRGWRQGILSTLIRLLGWLAAVTVIFGFSQQWAETIYFALIEPRAVAAVAAAIPADALASMNSGAEAIAALQQTMNGLTGLYGGQTVDLSSANTIVALFQQDAGSLAQIVTQTVLQPMLINVVRAVLAILVLVACLLVFRSLARFVRARRGGGVLNRTNRILGVCLGLGEGVITAYVYALILAAVAASFAPSWLTPQILNETFLVKLFL